MQSRSCVYFFDEEIGNYCLGGGNPMRPHRVRMTTSLVKSYGLDKKMQLLRPRARTFEELAEFHADDYLEFLRTVTPDNQEQHMVQLRRFNMGLPGEADCPVFDGILEYCQIYSGGSVDGAAILARGEAEIAFNWSGGMHHAKKGEASGFCYVNDIVLGILELLKVYQRVLYVDIDIHHGDGVEEAFYLTDRVMTVSFHKYGDFFPGTGHLGDIGYGRGKYYAVNVPLREGMDDASYMYVFEPIMAKVMEVYQPEAIVVCGGADSLSGDRLGCFNLSLEGHARCLEFLAKYNVPMMLLGGGGYTMRNVARCWCYETGRMLGVDLPDELPESAMQQYNFYMDTQRLRIATSNMKNMNSKEYLNLLVEEVLKALTKVVPAPSVQIGGATAPVTKQADLPEEDPDVRGGGAAYDDRRVERDAGSDDEDGKPTRYEYNPRADPEYAGVQRPADLADRAASGDAAGAGQLEEAKVAAAGGQGPKGSPVPAHAVAPGGEVPPLAVPAAGGAPMEVDEPGQDAAAPQ